MIQRMFVVVLTDVSEPHLPHTVIGPFSTVIAAQAYLEKELETEYGDFERSLVSGQITVLEIPQL